MPLTLIKALTASSSSSLDFVNGTSDVVFDSTYNEYQFYFVNMHPSTDAKFTFQVDTGTNTSYNQAIQSTFFYSWHKEDDSSAGVGYEGNNDQGNGTSYQPLAGEIVDSGDADSGISGILTLYDPSSTTYVKHFSARGNYFQQDPAQQDAFISGYVNTTTALTRISFKFASGNIDEGTIYMYGVS